VPLSQPISVGRSRNLCVNSSSSQKITHPVITVSATDARQ